jgi:hypothetical protein
MLERSLSAVPREGASRDDVREPVFVVGVSRSGTTLLAAMLNAHSRIFCGPETFFFPRLARHAVPEIVNDPRWPERATAFMTSIRLGGSDVRIHDLFRRDSDQIRGDLDALPPSVPSLLEALVGARARAQGKARWAEKTPNHLLFLEDIRWYYPRAPIVRLVRDPRDVALSLTKVPFGSPSKLSNLYLWLERDERSWRFFESDQHSITITYERLVSNPREELMKVCHFIGEPFEEQMLQTQAAANLRAPIEWWKERASQPVDGSRAGRWLAHYTKEEARAARAICHDALARYGYSAGGARPTTVLLHPLTRQFVERHEQVLIDLAGAGVRLEPWTWRRSGLSRVGDTTPTVFWGLPQDLRWSLGPTIYRRCTNILDLAAFLTRQALARRRPMWVRQPSGLSPDGGLGQRACNALLRVASRPCAPDQIVERVSR